VQLTGKNRTFARGRNSIQSAACRRNCEEPVRHLNVLDEKGLALLAFDGIVVAATTFAAEKGGVFHRPGLARWLATSIIVLSLAAAALCLGVSEISYRFFQYVECSTPDKLDFSNEITHLASLVDWRTWLFSIIAISLFLVMFSVSLNWRKQSSS
jgi:hypothetical protein